MSPRFLFGLQLDAGTGPIVDAAARHPGPPQARATVRFSYPELAPPDPAEPPPLPAAAPEPPPPLPPTFSEAELSSAVSAARREGYAEAEAKIRADTMASLEHRQAEALAAIRERLAASQDALDHILAGRTGASHDLALALARALVAKALARQPLADIEAMLREVVVRLEGLPWLELRLPPDLVPAGQAALGRVAEEAGFQGEIRVLPDVKLGPGDVRLLWQDGTAERDLARLEAEVTALVEAWLPATQAAPSPGDSAPSPTDLSDPRTDGFE